MAKELLDYVISVIVPVFDIKDFLPKCIESIQGQTYSNLQIILVDDGSTDGSGMICDKYAEDDSRIEVLHVPNGGLVTARKRGLDMARGDFIGFVDGDDFIDADMYREMLVKLLETGADFIHTGYYIENRDSQSIEMNFAEGIYELGNNKVEFILNHTDIFMDGSIPYMTNSIWSKLFRAGFICKAYSKVPDYQQLGEDGVCLCVCIMEARKFALCREAYYHYVVRDESLSHHIDVDNIVKYTDLYRTLTKLFRDYGCFSEVREELERFIKTLSIAYVERCCLSGACIEKFIFPMTHKIMGKKVVIYGAGHVGQNYYTQISRFRNCEIVAWVDRDYYKYRFEYCDVLNPGELKNIAFDFIIIAVNDADLKNKIQSQLESMGIEKDKIMWKKPKSII